MAEGQFSIDPDRLHAEIAELKRLAAETAQIAAELREAHTRRGVFWGDDQPGKGFGAGYELGVEQGIGDFENLAAYTQELAIRVASASSR
ncbi:hypothetical protein [Nocardia jinanensis]|uniref:WXG100 family type VII secretion target n=1 Tax=Nocardia jinanensis TaxID=382504 RepID=A0A917S1B1_9NOCA|nr:hypothetical protein [Nocardia jinanensis]GGL46546.1 hypothetical protein GCM10011588_71700 [Nocardia jinanensis]